MEKVTLNVGEEPLPVRDKLPAIQALGTLRGPNSIADLGMWDDRTSGDKADQVAIGLFLAEYAFRVRIR